MEYIYKTTNIYKKIEQNNALICAINDIRTNCKLLGDSIKKIVPSFTDHSVKHMDALWKIADVVLTPDEVEQMSISEAFILGASFYFHDLGMAIAATSKGVELLKCTEKYSNIYNRAKEVFHFNDDEAGVIALQTVSREMHAENANKLSTEKIPGLDKYIIEKEELRRDWAHYIGEISQSHHWSISTIDQRMGVRGRIPSPLGDPMDLAFIACMLRVIDYAHINSERADFLERMFRNVNNESIVHWKAQENIDGPIRENNRLKFVSKRDIENVEAWWLFYDMATGLDKEIVAVSEFLAIKSYSKGRFSLEGVNGVKSPKTFASLIRTSNFDPIDVRFKPDSIERLVDILGGKTLYGDDLFAPLRELIQNARDAILLREKDESKNGEDSFQGKLTITLDRSETTPKLIVKDNGVGMTSFIIENYLLGIASDYWNSEDFYTDYPDAKRSGFLPTGKFGIGFLSIFMIGDNVCIETERKTKPRLMLNLRGLGKHGSLKTIPSKANFGSIVSVEISKQDATIYNNLDDIIKRRSPMLTFPIQVVTPTKTNIIKPEWWKSITQEDFYIYVISWHLSTEEEKERIVYRSSRNAENKSLNLIDIFNKWPGNQPEILSNQYRVMAIPNQGKIILCSHGIAIKSLRSEGLIGIIEINDIQLTASRNQTIKTPIDEIIEDISIKMKPQIIEAINTLESEGMIPSRFDFIDSIIVRFGQDIFDQITLPWISILTHPGQYKLVNSESFKNEIQNSDEILIGYNLDPWSIEKECRTLFNSATNNAIIIPVKKMKSDPDCGSYKEDGTYFKYTIPQHFSIKDNDLELYKNAYSLTYIINQIAIAWGISFDKIISIEWIRNRKNHMCAHIIKSELI